MPFLTRYMYADNQGGYEVKISFLNNLVIKAIRSSKQRTRH